MFLAVLVVVLVAGVKCMPQFPPFSRNTDSSSENIRAALHLNKQVFCSVEQVTSSWGMRELQDVVEAMSIRKRMSPYLLLSQLLERLRSRHVLEENLLNSLEGAALQEILEPSINFPPPPHNSVLHGTPKGVPYILQPEIKTTRSEEEEETSLMFVPFSKNPRQQHFPIKPDNSHRYEIIGRVPSLPSGGGITNMLPSIINVAPLGPPMGVTIHVDSGDFGGSLPDVKVTISPFMTIVEALRQADQKYHNVLGLSPNTDVITFVRSTVYDCHVVSRVDGVKRNEEYIWKISVTDREGQELYNDVCLPDEKRRLLKPGSVISLYYIRL